MTALYRSERQAEALKAYRAARATLVDELGIEPSAWLTELHAAILRHDVGLAHPGPQRVVAGLDDRSSSPLYRWGDSDRWPPRGPAGTGGVARAAADDDRRDGRRVRPRLGAREPPRARLVAEGVEARAAVFTSIAPGADMARLAREHDVDLLLADAPDGLLEDARVLALSITRPATWASWSGVSLLAQGQSSCRLRAPSTTGPPSSWGLARARS